MRTIHLTLSLALISYSCFASAAEEVKTPESVTPNSATQPSEAATAVASKEPDQEDVLAPTYSCSIHFPLDSVRFDEKRIDECFAGIDPKAIAYIHVIATATPEGSIKHNLYLSTRRAGALEGYLRNRYPDIEIHAFGGGENPKAGKMARIIIVTRKVQQNAREKVVMYKPEVVTKVQEVTKIQYVDRPEFGLKVSTASGVTSGANAYQFMQLAVAKNISWRSVKGLSAGLAYRMLRSNRLMDLTGVGLFVTKDWLIRKMSYDSELHITASPLAQVLFKKAPQAEEGLAKTENQTVEFGVSSTVEYVKARYIVGLEAQYTDLYQSYGLGIGVNL